MPTMVISSSAGTAMIPKSSTKSIVGVYACFDQASSAGTVVSAVVSAVQVNTSIFYKTEYGEILRKDRIIAISTDSFFGKSDTRKEFIEKTPIPQDPPENKPPENRPPGKISTVGK